MPQSSMAQMPKQQTASDKDDMSSGGINKSSIPIPIDFQSLKKSEITADALSDTVNVDFFLLINKYEKYFNESLMRRLNTVNDDQ